MAKSDLLRENGKEKKGSGWLGPIKNDKGQTMTEISVKSNIGGKKVSYPILVPTLTKKEIETLANMKLEGNAKNIPDSIIMKAKQHALQRIEQGLSPFYQDGEK